MYAGILVSDFRALDAKRKQCLNRWANACTFPADGVGVSMAHGTAFKQALLDDARTRDNSTCVVCARVCE